MASRMDGAAGAVHCGADRGTSGRPARSGGLCSGAADSDDWRRPSKFPLRPGRTAWEPARAAPRSDSEGKARGQPGAGGRCPTRPIMAG